MQGMGGRSVGGRRNWVGARARCRIEKEHGAGASLGWGRSWGIGGGSGWDCGGKSGQKKWVGDEEEHLGGGRFGLSLCRATLHTVPGEWDGDRTRAGDRDGEGVKSGGGFGERVGVEEPCAPG